MISIAHLSPEQKRQLLASLLQQKQQKLSLPLSFVQQRLWFLDQLQPGLATYNLPAAFRLEGVVNVDILKQSFLHLIQRHEVLRTSFSVANTGDGSHANEPHQQIHPPTAISSLLKVIDLRQASAQLAQQAIDQEATQPFDLTEAPLLRATLLQRADAEAILLVTLHHIIADYWSLRVLIRELTLVYQALQIEQSPVLPELPIQYADYAAWQRQWLEGEERAVQLDYWREQLREQQVLQLPTDFPRPKTPSFRGAKQAFQLTTEQTEAIKQLSRREGLTLFMTLLAAFQILLYRYTGQTDISIGSTVANRDRAEIENLVGLFVNNLVFRVQVFSQLSIRDFLHQVREITLSAYTHQNLPYEYLVEQLQPDRQLGHNPLFQVAFVLHNTPQQEVIELPDLELRYLEPQTQTARFDLSLDMDETPAGLIGVLEYSLDLFKPDTIKQFIEHFKLLLDGIVKNPAQKISELPLLTEFEQQQLIKWNQTENIYPTACLPQLFEAQAALTPDAVAVCLGEAQLTYSQLNAQANQLAHHLLKLGITAETPVALYLDRSLEMLVALLAILKAGGSYLPIDPALPAERIAFMLSDAQVSLLVTTSLLQSQLIHPDITFVLLDADDSVITQQPTHNPLPPIPQQSAYLLYTSGSTGQPKAVQILHSALSNFLQAIQQQLCLTHTDRLLAVTTLSFDIAALELFLPLIAGAKVVIATRETAMDAAQLKDALCQHQVTLMQATPATWRLLLQADWQGKPDLMLLCGGEALDGKLATKLLARGKTLWNLYGPTETTIWSTAYRVEHVADTDKSVPIGRPLANQHCYVLDAQQQAVPIGVAGELYIGGAGLARGYYNRPELSAERFVPCPQPSNERADLLYRTGDLVRYLADGNLEYLGRLDHQVKLRGYRIELGEIEAVLRRHLAVEAAVVLLREDGGEQRLVAYVVSSNVDQSALREQLQGQLPAYMLPSAIVMLEQMPLTPNGKLNRRALPTPEVQFSRAEITAKTPVEELLVNIWQDILGTTAITIEDNFFELGGHSLLATRVIAQIRQVLGVELPLRHLFEQPTVAALAQVVTQLMTTAQTGFSLPPLTPSEQPTLSFAQQRQWFLAQLEPDSPFYNIPAAIQIQGELDADILQQCFDTVLQRHQVLRTAFQTVAGQPVLALSAAVRLEVPLIDLATLSTSAQTQQIHDLAEAEANQPIAIDQVPLLRLKLLRRNLDTYVLLLTLHHIVADGWSVEILLREVAALYAAFRQAEPSPLPDLPIQFADFASWQRGWLQGEILEAQIGYWRQQLQNLPALLELPSDYSRPALQSSRGGSFAFTLTAETALALKNLSQRAGCTLFMTLLAAFKLLLHRYSHREDIVVGTPIANRSHSTTEQLIGCFANMLVLRTDLSGNPSFIELLQRVKQMALGAYTHQDLPFEQLVEALQPQRSLSYSPLFQVMFSFQSAPIQSLMQSLSLDGLTWSSVQRDRQTTKFDLTLAVTESGDKLISIWEYSLDLFEPATIQRWAGHFQQLLDGIVSQPEARLSDLPLLTVAEQQQLADWNQTQNFSDASETLIHSLFEDQVQRSPDAVAVICDEQQLTYRELNARANQLAHWLVQLGAQPEAIIGICLERSLDLIIGLLGILKAGAAYLPLDPAYPAERLAFMLQDAEVKLLLTNSPALASSAVAQPLDLSNLAQFNPDNLNLPLSPANLAYVIYTSGSTGQPKGVAITHRNTTALLHWATNTFSHHILASTLASTSICFDLSIFEIFAPLCCGGSLTLVDNALHLPHLRSAHHLTLLNTVPSAAQQLVQLNAIPPSIQTVTLAGEALSQSLVQELYQQPQIQQVYNLYGPSEDTTYSTWSLVSPEQSHPPIGRPIANSQAYLLDRHLNAVPIGVVGELYLGGSGVARGYLNRPELTAERFVPCPAVVRNLGGYLYRTGDLGRYLPTGELEYLGRRDQQVKLRGFRIELGEIEATLNQHPDVQQAVAHIWTDATGHARLVAYVLSRTVTPLSLRAFLQNKLPDYMLPAVFVPLEALPLTPNGKIDRRALPAPERIQSATQPATAPRSSIEQTLVEIWQTLLGAKAAAEVGIHDNFFELGGDSILAIQVIAQASQAGLQLRPKHLFQAQTIAELAMLVNQSGMAQAEQGIVTGAVPLTPIQHWFFEQNWVDPQHWNQAVLLEVGRLDPQVLAQAIRLLLNHHDALRLRFQQTESGWQQVNALPQESLPFSVLDLSMASDQPEALKTAIETAATALQTSLDLATTPLRIALFKCGDDPGARPDRLLWVSHHLLIDGVSWRILLADLQHLYQQLQAGQVAQLPPKTTSFRQWATALQTAARRIDQLDYWQFTTAATPLPRDFWPGGNTVADLETVSVRLTAAETQALLQVVPAAYQTQVNDALLTALAQAFADWTGSRSLLIELEGHGREDLPMKIETEQIDLSRTVGWFTTLFPVWLNLKSGQVSTALKSIKEQLRAVPQRGIGYGMRRYLTDAKSQAKLPSPSPEVAPEVRFNYLGQLDQALMPPFALAAESVGATRSPLGDRGVLLEINALILAGELRLTWGYSRAIHAQTTVKTLAERFIVHLRDLIQHCQSPDAGGYSPSDFPLMSLSQTELDDLLADL